MRRRLIYRVQELAYGGLAEATRQRLREIDRIAQERARQALEPDRPVRHWEHIGFTEGFGTVHMTRPTIEAIRELAITANGMRNVNNQFGEGTSPLMRQLREGLTVLGFEPNDVLQHSNRRIAYMLELYGGAYADLCLDSDHHTEGPSTEAVAEAWRERWLRMRVKNDEILDRVAAVGPQAVMVELGIQAPATIGTTP